jgi:hypothetical protein
MADVATVNIEYNKSIKKAEGFIKNKDFEEALKFYQKALSTKPDEVEPKSKIEKITRLLEIREKINQTQSSYAFNKAYQSSLKIVLNATYGAFANQYFVLSNSKIANAITVMGRDLINYMASSVDNYFYNFWHKDINAHKLLGLEYIVQNKKDNLYYFLDRNFNKTDKRGYTEFNSGNKSNDILMSRRIGLEKLVEHKGTENLEDYNILYDYKIHDFIKIVPLDLNPTWEREEESGYKLYKGPNSVVRYQDTDSMYMSYEPIMKSVEFKGDPQEFILHFDKVIMKKIYNKLLTKYGERFNVENKHDFELETISKSILFFEKKHYLKDVIWEDGVYYPSMSHFSPTGIKIVRSSTPPFVRGQKQSGGIWEFIRYIFDNADNLNIQECLKIVKELRKEFEMSDIEDISMTTSVTGYEDKVLNDTTGIEVRLASNFSLKAAALHNYLLNKNSEYKTKYDTIKDGKVKYYYCKHPLNNVFAYTRGSHPTEIVEKEGVQLDYEIQFDKTVLSICNDFMRALDLPLINKRISVLNSLFGFKLDQKADYKPSILVDDEADVSEDDEWNDINLD